MSSNHVPSSIIHISHLIAATLLCMCCAGCTDDRASDANTTLNTSAADAQINQVISSDLSTKPLVVRSRTDNSTATSRRVASSLEHLQSESALIFEGGISSQVAADLLRSGRSTSDVIDRMTQDAATSTEAQDLAKHYRSSITRAMGEDAQLERLSCGLSICIGIARAKAMPTMKPGAAGLRQTNPLPPTATPKRLRILALDTRTDSYSPPIQ